MKLIFDENNILTHVILDIPKELNEVDKFISSAKKGTCCKGWLSSVGYDGDFVVCGYKMYANTNVEDVVEISVMPVID